RGPDSAPEAVPLGEVAHRPFRCAVRHVAEPEAIPTGCSDDALEDERQRFLGACTEEDPTAQRMIVDRQRPGGERHEASVGVAVAALEERDGGVDLLAGPR